MVQVMDYDEYVRDFESHFNGQEQGNNRLQSMEAIGENADLQLNEHGCDLELEYYLDEECSKNGKSYVFIFEFQFPQGNSPYVQYKGMYLND